MATEKISVTVDRDLLKEVRSYAECRKESLSAVVNEALVREMKLEGLRALVDENERIYGPVPEELVEDVLRRWRG